jgi:hypothetical protein
MIPKPGARLDLRRTGFCTFGFFFREEVSVLLCMRASARLKYFGIQ